MFVRFTNFTNFLIFSVGNKCVASADEFKTIFLDQAVLRNVLVGLQETTGDNLETDITNRYQY